MKKSNQYLNKIINKKDIINSLSAFSLFIIIAYGILSSLLILSPESTGVGNISLLIEDRIAISSAQNYIFCCEAGSFHLLTLVAGLVMGLVQFEFLHRKTFLSTLLTFGIKRNTVFLHRFLAPLPLTMLCILIPHFVALKCNIDTFGFSEDIILPFILQNLIFIQCFLFAYSISVISCVFTGRTLEAAAGAFSAIILPSAITLSISDVFESFLYGFSGNSTPELMEYISLLDPTYIMSFNYNTYIDGMYPAGVGFGKEYIIRLVIALIWLCVSIAAVIFTKQYFDKKFKAENCGFKGINKYMVYLTSFAAPLYITYIVTSSVSSYFYPIISNSIKILSTVLGVAAGFAVSVLIGFIIHLSFKKLKPSIMGGASVIGTVIILVVVSYTGIFGTFNYVPKQEDIEKIEIESPFTEFLPELGQNNDFTMQVAYHSFTALTVTDSKDFETVLELHEIIKQRPKTFTTSKFNITYVLKDGKKISRSYMYLSEDVADIIIKLWDTNAAKELYKRYFFPEYNGPETFDFDPKYTKDRYEHPHIMDYKDSSAFINITSRDGNVSSVHKKVGKDGFNKLKNALYKDICNMTAEQWFKSDKAQLGTLSFAFAGYQNIHDFHAPVNFFISPEMENTLKVLEELNLLQYFENKKEIKRVLVGDIKEYISWNNGIYNLNKKDIATHQPYFTQNYDAFCILAYTSDPREIVHPPVKEITDKLEIKSLTENSLLSYNVINNGRLVFVEYADETYACFVLPY